VAKENPRRPERRRLTGGSFALIVGVAIVILVAGALIGRKLHNQESASHAVTYRVTSSTSGAVATQVSYLTTRSTRRIGKVDLPWSYSGNVQAFKSGAPATLKVQQAKGDRGTISCEIDVDGTSVSTKTATGPNAVVSCSAPLK
jgi:hypothetical protein